MPITPPELIDFPGFPTVVVRFVDHPVEAMPQAMDAAFGALGRAIGRGVFHPTGPAFSRYEAPPGEVVTFETGFPVDVALDAPLVDDAAGADAGDVGDAGDAGGVGAAGESGGVATVEIVPSSLPACRLAITRFTGPYDGLGRAWGEFTAALREAGHETGLPFWEAYDTPPGPDVDPATLVTGLAVPIVGGGR